MKECIWIDWRSPKVHAVCCVAIVILSFMFFCTQHVVQVVYFGYAKSPRAFRGLENDAYGDVVKSALAHKERALEFTRQHSDQAARWPEQFRTWLTENIYQEWSPELTCGEPVPLSAIILAGLRAALFRYGPVPLLCGLFLAYVCCTGLVTRFVLRSANFGWPSALVVGLLLMFSWPALFMFQRGHVSAGMSALCVFSYLALRFSDQHGNVAGLLLALAVNLRPQYAAFGLIELASATSFWEGCRRIILIACLVGVVAATSFYGVHAIHREYTMHSMGRSLENYRDIFIRGDWGLQHGASLFGLVKLIRLQFLGRVGYNAAALIWMSGFGVLFAGISCVLSVRGRVTKIEAAFISCAITVLFCPVVAVYHLLCFVSPLALAVSSRCTMSDKTSYVCIVSASTICLTCLPHPRMSGWVVPVVLFVGLVKVILNACSRRHSLRCG